MGVKTAWHEESRGGWGGSPERQKSQRKGGSRWGQGRSKGWKIGWMERGQRERRVQSFIRAPPAPPPSLSDPRCVWSWQEASVYSCVKAAADQPPPLWTRHKAPGGHREWFLCDGCWWSSLYGRLWLYSVSVVVHCHFHLSLKGVRCCNLTCLQPSDWLSHRFFPCQTSLKHHHRSQQLTWWVGAFYPTTQTC